MPMRRSTFRSWAKAKLRGDADRRQPRAPESEAAEAPPERPPLNLVANVADEQMSTWESQAGQYPPTGPPGISYFRGELNDQFYVDCLLYRDETGTLAGILNHYPMDIPPLQHAGDKNIWVHPQRRRQGIGTALLLESFFRWGPRQTPHPNGPQLTDSGVRFLSGVEESYRGSHYDFRDMGWEAWNERRSQELEDPDTNWRDVGWEAWHKRQEKEHGPDGETPRSEDPDT